MKIKILMMEERHRNSYSYIWLLSTHSQISSRSKVKSHLQSYQEQFPPRYSVSVPSYVAFILPDISKESNGTRAVLTAHLRVSSPDTGSLFLSAKIWIPYRVRYPQVPVRFPTALRISAVRHALIWKIAYASQIFIAPCSAPREHAACGWVHTWFRGFLTSWM
jgi:hypothetical protein